MPWMSGLAPSVGSLLPRCEPLLFSRASGRGSSGKFICTEMNPRCEKEPPCTFSCFFACHCCSPFWNEVGSQMMVKTSNIKDNKSSVHKHVTHILNAQHVHIHEQLVYPRRCSESVCEDPPDFTEQVPGMPTLCLAHQTGSPRPCQLPSKTRNQWKQNRTIKTKKNQKRTKK